MKTCASCGVVSERLLEVFAGGSVSGRQPFCADCIDLGACELILEVGEIGPRAVVQSLFRVSHVLIRELRGVQERLDSIDERVAALEASHKVDVKVIR